MTFKDGLKAAAKVAEESAKRGWDYHVPTLGKAIAELIRAIPIPDEGEDREERWLVFNDPFFTDKAPYCNTLRYITEADAIAYWRRLHPHNALSDVDVLHDFMAVDWAWQVEAPTATAIAAARADERAKIAAWLRADEWVPDRRTGTQARDYGDDPASIKLLNSLADAIERGDHALTETER